VTNWRRVRLKNVVDINRRSLPEATDAGTEFRYIDISTCGRGALVAEPEAMQFGDSPSRARRLVFLGDTIVSTVRTYLRAVWPVTGRTDDLVVSTGFAVLCPRPGLHPGFLGWLIQSDVVIEEIVARSVGVSYPAINGLEVGEIAVAVPHAAEQRAIAEYLDAETARIDALVRVRKRMLDQLAMRRRATIDHSLMPANAPGWELVPVKFMIRRIEQGWSPQCDTRPADEEEWGVLKAGAANGGLFKSSENKALPPDVTPLVQYEVRQGDLLVSRANTRELLASACIVPAVRPRLLLCDKLYRLTPAPNVDPRFLAYALSTSRARHRIEAEATGTSDSMQNVGQDTIRELRVWGPRARAGQTLIADRLDHDLKKSRRLNGAMEAQIELLLERRRALITAAVTGQLEIPGAAA
jgi:type I restriction enzyme S subunit